MDDLLQSDMVKAKDLVEETIEICVVGEFKFWNEFNKAFRKQERSLKVYSEDHTRKGVKKQDLSNEEPPLDRVLWTQ